MLRFNAKGDSNPFFNAELTPLEETREINMIPRRFSRELDLSADIIDFKEYIPN